MRISDWSSDVCSSDLDNEISWLRWEGLDPLDSAFAGFVATALAIRRSYPELRQPDFLHGEPVEEAGSPNVQWLGAEGTPMPEDGWRDPIVKVIGLLYSALHGRRLLLLSNSHHEPVSFQLPPAAVSAAWDTAIGRAHV